MMMEKLPPEMVLDIFYLLPPKTVVLCKLVCKSWCSLLPHGNDGNYFANMQLRRRHQLNLEYSTLNFVSLQEFRDNDHKKGGRVVCEFHITEYNEVEGRLNRKVKRLVFSQICVSGWLGSRLVGSCNGLLCLTRKYCRRVGTTSMKGRTIGICNPLLHEYVTLPLSDLQFKQYATAITGFGHNSITDEYKVVSVYYSHSPYIGEVEVYTLGKNSNGAGMWRSKGTIKYWLQSFSRYVFINRSIHSLADTGSEQIIVSFDLEDEEFRVMPLPSDLNITNTSIEQLRELRGCLCLIGRTRDTWALDLNRNLDIWVLKKDHYMNKESWVKEFSIKYWKGQPLSYLSFSIKKKKKKKDGDAILCWRSSKSSKSAKRLVSYNPKTEKFVTVGGRKWVGGGLIFDSVLHINSFVSLKALGEDAKYARMVA